MRYILQQKALLANFPLLTHHERQIFGTRRPSLRLNKHEVVEVSSAPLAHSGMKAHI